VSRQISLKREIRHRRFLLEVAILSFRRAEDLRPSHRKPTSTARDFQKVPIYQSREDPTDWTAVESRSATKAVVKRAVRQQENG